MSDTTEKPEWRTKEFWQELIGSNRDERIDEVSRDAFRWSYIVLCITLVGATAYYFYLGRPVASVLAIVILLSAGQYWWLIGRHNFEEVDEFSRYQKRRLYLYLAGPLSLIPITFMIYYMMTISDETRSDLILWTAIFTVSLLTAPVVQFGRGAFPLKTVVFTVVSMLVAGTLGFLLGSSNLLSEWGLSLVLIAIVGISLWQGYTWYKKRPW